MEPARQNEGPAPKVPAFPRGKTWLKAKRKGQEDPRPGSSKLKARRPEEPLLGKAAGAAAETPGHNANGAGGERKGEGGDFRQLAHDHPHPQVPNDTEKGFFFPPVHCSLAISLQEMDVVTKCMC